jgi:hypothetical protein
LASYQVFPFFTRRTRAQLPPSKSFLHDNAGVQKQLVDQHQKKVIGKRKKPLTAKKVIANENVDTAALKEIKTGSQLALVSKPALAIPKFHMYFKRVNTQTILFINVQHQVGVVATVDNQGNW